MSKVDRFFNDEIKAIASESKAIANQAAMELKQEVQQQIRRNFNNPSAAFVNGIKIYDYENSVYVRLSPILTSHARSVDVTGNPNLWILLPDGARLGFKRMGTGGFDWNFLKRRYGSRLSFVAVADGHVVLFRSDRGVVPVYKIQAAVRTKQRIRFYEAAEEIAEKYGMETDYVDARETAKRKKVPYNERDNDREVGFK